MRIFTITIDFFNKGDPEIWTQSNDLTPEQKEMFRELVKEIKQAITPKQLTLIKSTYGERSGIPILPE